MSKKIHDLSELPAELGGTSEPVDRRVAGNAPEIDGAAKQQEELQRLLEVGLGATSVVEALAEQQEGYRRQLEELTNGLGTTSIADAVTEQQESYRRQLEGLANSIGTASIAAVTEQQEGYRRQLEELANGLGATSIAAVTEQQEGYRRQLEELANTIGTAATGFPVIEAPSIIKSHDMIERLVSSDLAGVITRFENNSYALQEALDAIEAPWFNVNSVIGSFSGIAELHELGSLVSRAPTFEDNMADMLRTDLGDWREALYWPEEVLTDMTARREFYKDLGFNTSLTEFPATAFRESVEISGLRSDPPRLVDLYGPPILPADTDDEERAIVRTNDAHDWLFRLESELRKFIDEKMSDHYGPNWQKQRLPGDIYKSCTEKKRDFEGHGAPERPLMAYLDFTDYLKIIVRKDNWREVFARFFQRPENVSESLQRIHLIRLDTMHARTISQDDELLLYVETNRLTKAIRS